MMIQYIITCSLKGFIYADNLETAHKLARMLSAFETEKHVLVLNPKGEKIAAYYCQDLVEQDS